MTQNLVKFLKINLLSLLAKPRLILIKLLLVSLLFLSSSCLTKSLWKNSYNDTVQNFLVSADGSYIVFLGSKYHYIFNDHSHIMKELLSWRGRHLLFIDVKRTRLKVDKNNNVSGYATVESFFNNLRGDQRVFLQSLGFRRLDGEVLGLKVKLKGKRYLPRHDLGRYVPELNRKYVFDIKYSPNASKAVAIATLTPITLAADSIYLFGRIVLHPFRD